MRQTLSILVLIVVYLGAAFLVTDYDWLSKLIPATLGVISAWLVCRTISKVLLVTALVILGVVFPISLLVFGLAATDSVSENMKLLGSRLSVLDVLIMFVPVVVGYVVALGFSHFDSSRGPT
jgi:hypothetical protein